MKQCNTLKFGLTGGIAMAFFHLCWLALVGLGWAQAFIDWVLQLHMIQPFYVIMPFQWGNAILLLVVTFVVGFIGGSIIGCIWHCCRNKK